MKRIMNSKNWIKSSLVVLLICCMGSCAKENLPEATPALKSYGKLYLVQASLTGNINFRIYVDSYKRDTSFNLMNVMLGGQDVASHDVPVQFQILDQTYVDAYNNLKGLSAKLLPSGNYVLNKDVTIKKGTNSTGTLPISLNLEGLSNGEVYVLPVKFQTSDATYEIDDQKQIAYYVFTCKLQPVGKYMGNIPQINDPRVQIFTFYDDLMLQDTLGDLWVYPLKDRETIGEPVKVASGFADVTSLFFNQGYNRLVGIINKGSYQNAVVSWTVTNMPNVKIGDTVLAYKSADYAAGFVNSFFQGINGGWYGVYKAGTTDGTFYYFAFNSSATAATRTNINSGWTRDVYRDPCIIKNNVIVNHPTGLLLYVLAANGATFPGNRWQVGNGFSKYAKIFSYKMTDLIGVKPNGDMIRYANFDINGFYIANE